MLPISITHIRALSLSLSLSLRIFTIALNKDSRSRFLLKKEVENQRSASLGGPRRRGRQTFWAYQRIFSFDFLRNYSRSIIGDHLQTQRADWMAYYQSMPDLGSFTREGFLRTRIAFPFKQMVVFSLRWHMQAEQRFFRLTNAASEAFSGSFLLACLFV